MQLRFEKTIARITGLSDAYKRVFESPDGERVLADLARFSGANEPATVPGDPYATHYNDGQRRLFLRIQSMLGMTGGDVARIARLQARMDEDGNVEID